MNINDDNSAKSAEAEGVAKDESNAVLASASFRNSATTSTSNSTPAETPSLVENPSAPPAARKIHERNVSWGQSSLDSESRKLPPQPPERKQPPKVSLRDVLQQHPAESEAVTRVLESVETEQDPTPPPPPARPTTLSAQSSLRRSLVSQDQQQLRSSANLLRHVPVGAEGAFRATESQPSEKSFDGTSSNRSHVSTLRGVAERLMQHKRTKTMEQRLDSLTDALEMIHGDEADELMKFLPPDEEPAHGSVDTMNKHADLLRQRQRKRTEDVELQGQTTPTTTAASNWSKVRTLHMTVGLANAIENSDKEHHDELDSASDNVSAPPRLPTDLETGLDDARMPPADLGQQQLRPSPQHELSESDFRQPTEALGADPAAYLKTTNTKTDRVMEKIPGLREFIAFAKANQSQVRAYVLVILWIILPAVTIAGILFYLAGNPPTGRVDLNATAWNDELTNLDGNPIDPGKASASYWLLYICVRKLVTFSLAQAAQLFIIDFMCLGRRWASQYLGPITTLLIVQSRGWPFLLTFWCVFDLGMNSGKHKFAAHWLFWQDRIGLFSEQNPSGTITSGSQSSRLLIIGLCVGAISAVKRTWLGFFLGRKTYVNYAPDVTKVMKKIVLISKIANLAKAIEKDFSMNTANDRMHRSRAKRAGMTHEKAAALVQSVTASEEDENRTTLSSDNHATEVDESPFIIDPTKKDRLTGNLTEAQRLKLNTCLGAWEEPEKAMGVVEDVSVNAVLKFRQSLTFLDTPFMFSYAFGLVDTRENCIESSQEVYLRLLLDDPDCEYLNFDIISTLALYPDGNFNQDLLKDLVTLLRPDRDGNLTLIDFVKSIDEVYKQARLLRASIKNSQRIDRAFELIFNVIFYTIMASIILSQLGFDPFALFLSMSSIILAFAFMIGSASAKYFEGLLFILVQRPYDIGDRINIEPANSAGQPFGSVSWIVKDVTLFTTTIVLGATNEKATVSNGSLAANRILNGARSPNPVILAFIKFGIEVQYPKIQVFHDALSQFVKARPREWIGLLGFRASNIQPDLGFVEYIIILQHRSSWQDIGAVLSSKAEIQSFSLELAKKLDMRYQSPPMPVHLSMRDGVGAATALQSTVPQLSSEAIAEGILETRSEVNPADVQAVLTMFEKKNQ